MRLYFACYISWLALSALALWAMLQLRLNLIDLIILSRVSIWSYKIIDNCGTILLGALWIAVAIFIESYLREGVATQQLWARVWRVGIMEVSVLGLSYGGQYLVLM
jgi:hypothetical protein